MRKGRLTRWCVDYNTNMNKKSVSIIVPVYNVERYLKRCLDSLISQTLQNIEIIVVNDGSPDNSQEIIDAYISQYDCIKAYVKENGGQSDARNYGLARATGEYIAFVDSDDYVDKNMYEVMYRKAKESNYDVVVCDFEEIYESYVRCCSSRVLNDLQDRKQVKAQMCDMYPAPWNKIYKRELIMKGMEFKKGVWAEDVEWMYRLLPYVETIGVIKEAFYKYVQREGSVSRSNDLRIFDYIYNWNGVVDFYKENDLYNEYYYELEYSYVRYLYATFIKACLKMELKFFRDAVNQALTNVKTRFPNYRRNSYFYKGAKGIYLLMFNREVAFVYYFLNKAKNIFNL